MNAPSSVALGMVLAVAVFAGAACAETPGGLPWQFAHELLMPFWEGETTYGESVLFIDYSDGGEARASVLFPVVKVIAVRNSTGDITYEEGRDYKWKAGSREFTLPENSRITSCTPAKLRRPPKTQQYQLPHRDGNGEIYFGGRLEYQDLQTCITYTHAPDLWKSPITKFDPGVLPQTLAAFRVGQPVSIVVLGDSISAGYNASGWAGGPPFQPPYPELVRQMLEHRYHSKVTLTNLSVSGKDTAWALTMIDKIVEAKPHLVILAFGMNDASGRSAIDFKANTKSVIASVHEKVPQAEFILVASMIGNRNWTTLKPELFPAFRDALQELCGPGVVLADLTSVWNEFLKLKQDWDQTGNGVNHPNDFGHRAYAQVISSLLVPKVPEELQREILRNSTN